MEENHKNIAITLQYTSFNEFEKMMKCDSNIKIVEETVDIPPNVQPLPNRLPVPLNQIVKKNK